MGEARARRWLDRHGATDRPTTPLLRARLDARYQGEMLSWVLIGVAIVAYLVAATLSTEPRPGRTSLYQVGFFYAAMALAVIAGLWLQGRNERRIGQALIRRVAHPQAVSVGAVVGRWFVVATVVTVGAGVLVGVAAEVGAADPEDRGVGLILLAAVGVFALIGLVGLVHVVRRPAIAEDEQSLGDDLLLRREDALRVVLPYPALLALIAAIQSRSLTVLFVLLGYAVVAATVWFLANWAATHASAARPAAASTGATAA
jgi:hypothetical protein